MYHRGLFHVEVLVEEPLVELVALLRPVEIDAAVVVVDLFGLFFDGVDELVDFRDQEAGLELELLRDGLHLLLADVQEDLLVEALDHLLVGHHDLAAEVLHRLQEENQGEVLVVEDVEVREHLQRDDEVVLALDEELPQLVNQVVLVRVRQVLHELVVPRCYQVRHQVLDVAAGE